MATTSLKTARIRNIAVDISDDAFDTGVAQLANAVKPKKSKLPWKTHSDRPLSLSSTVTAKLKTSLATQNDNKIATVTFETTDTKTNALGISSHGWKVDDVFNGVTILHSPQDAEIDICTVHGLDGNGFDTWTAQNSSMWPRDILPTTGPFKKSRIMTFGYSSQIRDRANKSGVLQWADYLLTQVGGVRNTGQERQRPILFVCHSLGGLVAREAMIRLNAHPEKYTGIQIDNCGLLFLGTPHSGTVQADWVDWNAFVDGLLAVGGVRTEVLKDLKSFNGFGVESKEAFASIPTKPPYFCIHETKKAKIAGMYKHVVTPDSAGLNDVVAFPMPDVDHNEMCKFEDKFHDGYSLVIERLTRLRDKLLGQDHDQNETARKQHPGEAPGHPPVTAGRWPLPAGKHYYEGKELLKSDRLIGRSSEYQKLEEMITQLLDSDTESSAVAISGIGGVGKTELLLNLARRHRDQSNIFFLSAKDGASLREAYLFIANDLWSEILARRHPEGDRYRIWQGLSDKERIESFKRWLGEAENEDTFLMFDDMDGLPQADIADALPPQAKNVILTTRNPMLIAALSRECDLNFQHLGIAQMVVDDMVDFTAQSFRKMAVDSSFTGIACSDEHIKAIAKTAVGHPLIASRTISYILMDLTQEFGRSAVEEFVRSTSDATPEERGALLSHSPPLQCSILENFDISRTRLSDPDGHAWTLLKLVAFLSLDDGGFQKFLFYERQWINEAKDILAYYDIWSAKKHQIRRWMSNLAQVSLGSWVSEGETLQFHPVLIQCVQDMVGPAERIRITKDISILAYESAKRHSHLPPQKPKGSFDLFRTQARYCQELSDAWGITRKEHSLPEAFYKWLAGEADNKINTVANTSNLGTSSESNTIKESLLSLKKQCQDAKASFKELRRNHTNIEANMSAKKILFPIVEKLKGLDDLVSTFSPEERKRVDTALVKRVEEIYVVIIQLAQDPIMHSQILGDQLTAKKIRALQQFRE